MIPKTLLPELQLRWAKVRTAMAAAQIEACLLATNVNLIYLSGRVINGYAYITLTEDPIFFIKRPVGLEGEQITYIRKPEEIVSRLADRGVKIAQRVALEVDQLTYSEVNRLQAAMGGAALANATTLFKQARLIKTPYEIELLRKGGARHVECYQQLPALFVPGMRDIDLSIEAERLFRQKGSLGVIRVFGSSMELHMGSVLAGDNAQTPSPYDFAMGGAGTDPALPLSADGTRIEKGMAVMVDICGSFTANMTDMTRTYSYGRLSELAYKAHQICLEIDADVAAMARPGMACADLYNRAITKVSENGLSPYFMGTKQQAGFIGHGIGLELNEAPVFAPRSRDILAQGMTFALEPKMVIPGVGAVGIENSYVVTATGVECVTELCGEIVEL
ncbi:MAG: M24 family metallopeptidase [Phocaeicola sp.]